MIRVAIPLLAVALVGCKHKPVAPLAAPTAGIEDVLTMAHVRPVPDPAQGRFTVKMSSKPLKIAAPPLAGGLFVDRPGHLYLAIQGPFGSPVLTLATDGLQAGMLDTQNRRYLLHPDAEGALRALTSDAIGLDDVAAVMLGYLPFDDADVTASRLEGEEIELELAGPNGARMIAALHRSDGTLRRVWVDDAQGVRSLEVTYTPYLPVGDALLPEQVTFWVPRVELSVELRFREWLAPETVPDVFTPTAPEGFPVVDMVEAFQEGSLPEVQ